MRVLVLLSCLLVAGAAHAQEGPVVFVYDGDGAVVASTLTDVLRDYVALCEASGYEAPCASVLLEIRTLASQRAICSDGFREWFSDELGMCWVTHHGDDTVTLSMTLPPSFTSVRYGLITREFLGEKMCGRQGNPIPWQAGPDGRCFTEDDDGRAVVRWRWR